MFSMHIFINEFDIERNIKIMYSIKINNSAWYMQATPERLFVASVNAKQFR